MIAADKRKHFAVCFGVTLVCLLLFSDWQVALAIPLTLSIGKEAFDGLSVHGSGWSWGDLLADLVGILAGLGLYLLVRGWM